MIHCLCRSGFDRMISVIIAGRIMKAVRRKRYYCAILALAGIMAGTTGCGTDRAASEETARTETAGQAGDADQELEEKTVKSSELAKRSTITYELPSEAEEAGIYVEPVEDLPDDFIRGVDLSSVLAEEESGVVYYNYDGNEDDIFNILAKNGVNYIRVRVWNDPYDADGNSYGGGTNDTAHAAEIGKRAASYGMKLCVDFHYSDFWADPSKQMCPKAWEGMEIDEKAAALEQFTRDSLTQIIDAGADVGMVQIGNEINNGIAGEKEWSRRRKLLSAGAAAVRDVSAQTGRDILVAVHFTNVNDRSQILDMAKKLELEGKEIDYDVFAVSYYPFWHGTMENLTSVLKEISSTYGKKVVVAENSYLYTTGDGDGSGNSIGEGSVLPEYPATVQGQANEIRDVCAAVAAVGEPALGYFYWEPAWIPVGVWEEGAEDADEVYAANQKIWEEHGSGWASSYAGAYDPDDAGLYYGGSSWDNQALFDYSGQMLESLKVFKYLHCGTIVEQQVESIPDVEVSLGLEAEVEMPDTADIVLNDRSVIPVAVQWDEEAVAQIDTSKSGSYEVPGRFLIAVTDTDASEAGKETAADAETAQEQGLSDAVINALTVLTPVAHVNVEQVNLIANGSFEDADTSMWEIEGEGTDYQNKDSDAHSGDISLHFWSTSEMDFTVRQTLTGLEPGTYEFGLYLQGGDADGAQISIFADNGTDSLTQDTEVTGWCDWHDPVISGITVGDDGTLTVGASVKAPAKAWGTLDDFYLYQK